MVAVKKQDNDAEKGPKHLKCVNILIKAGADVNAKNIYGKTALMSVADNGYVNYINILIEAGANVNAESTSGTTALICSAKQLMYAAAEDGFLKCMKTLLKAGADPDRGKNEIGWTALFFAARMGSINCLKTLLEAGADVNSQSTDGTTALMIASHFGKHEFVGVLLAAGAGVNAADKDFCNALYHLAALPFSFYEHHLKCTKGLLKAGIHINRIHKSEDKNALRKALAKNSVKKGEEENYRSLLKLLYAGGETLDGTDVDKIPEELKFEEEQLELKHICREAIRKHLLKLDPHQHLFSRVPKLGLPSSLTSYLLFHISLDDDDTHEEKDDDDGDDV